MPGHGPRAPRRAEGGSSSSVGSVGGGDRGAGAKDDPPPVAGPPPHLGRREWPAVVEDHNGATRSGASAPRTASQAGKSRWPACGDAWKATAPAADQGVGRRRSAAEVESRNVIIVHPSLRPTAPAGSRRRRRRGRFARRGSAERRRRATEPPGPNASTIVERRRRRPCRSPS
jgi:hypothetical protein